MDEGNSVKNSVEAFENGLKELRIAGSFLNGTEADEASWTEKTVFVLTDLLDRELCDTSNDISKWASAIFHWEDDFYEDCWDEEAPRGKRGYPKAKPGTPDLEALGCRVEKIDAAAQAVWSWHGGPMQENQGPYELCIECCMESYMVELFRLGVEQYDDDAKTLAGTYAAGCAWDAKSMFPGLNTKLAETGEFLRFVHR